MNPPARAIAEVLLVEDNPGDVRLTQEALKSGNGGTRLHVVRDGVEAIAFLRRTGGFGDAVRPDLILLDLNLPRMDGREVLSEIKDDRDLRTIPVVILTTSKSDDDISRAYALHANCYMTKPVDFDEFVALVQKIQEFWLSSVSLPRRTEG